MLIMLYPLMRQCKAAHRAAAADTKLEMEGVV